MHAMIELQALQIWLDDRRLVDLSLTIHRSTALVGESGSGKSLTLKALLDMLPPTMRYDKRLTAPFDVKRGETVAFVPQNPFTSLSPLTRIASHFENVDNIKIETLFHHVGLAPDLMHRFPAELSGGQLQRVVIAIALSHQPKLLLLDEPTTALDPATRVAIITLLATLQEHYGFFILFVTHDIMSAESLCDEICVIRDGEVVESGTMSDVLHSPKHAYTQRLIEASFATREFRR